MLRLRSIHSDDDFHAIHNNPEKYFDEVGFAIMVVF